MSIRKSQNQFNIDKPGEMMILIIAGSSYVSGAEYVLKDYLEQSNLKKKIVLLTSDGKDTKNLFFSLDLKNIYFTHLLGQKGVLKTGKPSSIIKKLSSFIQIKKLIKQIIKNENITIVIGNNSGDIIYSYHVKKISKDIHFNLFVHDIIESKTLMDYIFRFFQKHIDKYIAVSKAVKDKMIELGINNSKIRVVYNGLVYQKTIRTQRFSPSNIHIGFIGNIEKRKAPLSFTDFINEIEKYPGINYKAFMVFKHFEENIVLQLRNEIKNKKLTITLLGAIERHKLDNFYSKIDFLFVPYYTDSFPTVILEAFNNGVPVIGRNSGGIPEMIDHNINGFLFSDNEEFSSIIRQIIKLNNSTYKSLSANANNTINDKFNIKIKRDLVDALLSTSHIV